MKKTFLLLVACPFIAISCASDDEENVSPNNTSLEAEVTDSVTTQNDDSTDSLQLDLNDTVEIDTIQGKTDDEIEKEAALLAQLKQNAVINYTNIVEASYNDAIVEAQKLKSAIAAFTTNPTQEGLNKCKDAWILAREPYSRVCKP